MLIQGNFFTNIKYYNDSLKKKFNKKIELH